jgi:hypothetical protein
MRLIPLNDKRPLLFRAPISTDQPEVRPCNNKLPLLQAKNCSGKYVKPFHPTHYRFEVFKLPHKMRHFQSNSAIEYP